MLLEMVIGLAFDADDLHNIDFHIEFPSKSISIIGATNWNYVKTVVWTNIELGVSCG